MGCKKNKYWVHGTKPPSAPGGAAVDSVGVSQFCLANSPGLRGWTKTKISSRRI